MKTLLFRIIFLLSFPASAQVTPFRFAFISDTHIGSPDGRAEEDLRRTVADINRVKDISFAVVTGDITELGTNDELRRAKQLLDSLNVPYYIIPGNHDTGWSESGGVGFITVFGNDKFSFEHQGVRFLGCASGPYVRMSDGHIPRSAINWLDRELKTLKPGQPLVFLNHYPIDNGLDNWYEITDRLRHHNTWAILCGHGHSNKAMNFEDIPGVMGRSNLRAKQATGGYNLVDVRNDSIVFTERRPGTDSIKVWTGIDVASRNFSPDKKFDRPDYSINKNYYAVQEKWRFSSEANIISTPAVHDDNVVAGNQDGVLLCLSLRTGRHKWSFNTGGAIFSSPAIARGNIVFGSGDGYVYCLEEKTGKLTWKHEMAASVLGSPVIRQDTVFIGGSDHSFVALDLHSGRPIWKFTGLQGPVVSTPLIDENRVIFGAWDRHLYALDKNSGKLLWKWNNGSPVRNFSPASCIPVAHDGVIYVVAPDRYLSAIDAASGKTCWRSNDAPVRESLGISADGKWIYCKTMQDTIVAYTTGREKTPVAWRMGCGFGYEHVPSMLIEREGIVFFGTKNGVVYAIDPETKRIHWAWKIDNSMVNTVRVLDGQRVVAATMDGKIVLLEATKK